MTLNRPGERAAMLWTFTVLLFCIREYKEGVSGSDPVIDPPMVGHLGEEEERIEGWWSQCGGSSLPFLSLFRAESGYDINR